MIPVSRLGNPTLFVSVYNSDCVSSLIFLKVVSVSLPCTAFQYAYYDNIKIIYLHHNKLIFCSILLCVYFYQYLETQGRKYQHLMLSLSNKRLFRVFPGLKRGTKPKQACILTCTTLPCSRSNKDHSSLLPVEVYL